MQNFRALGALPPDPCASGGWGLCPQTPSLLQLGAEPPDPQNSFPHCEFLATRLYQYAQFFHNFVFRSKKKRPGRPAAFLSLFRLRPTITWKIYQLKRMLPDTQPEFCWEGWTSERSKFFAPKLSDLGSVQNKLMQLQRVTNGDIVIEYVVTANGARGRSPQPLGDFCAFAAKHKKFLRHFNRTSHVSKPYESLNC